MCRLLGVVSTNAISVAEAVGDGVLADFVALTKVHGDGWGVAGTRAVDAAPRVVVSEGTAMGDPRFVEATHDERNAASLVHLRWATNGLAVAPQNSHPFLADGLAMAHNGSIKPLERLHEIVEPAVAATLGGNTDSELYFAVIRQYRRTTATLVEAVRCAVARLREIYPDASLNALVLGEGQLVVVHAHAHSRLLAEDIEEISATDLPTEHLEDYFSLRIARPSDDVVVVGSTGFGELPWEALPSEAVIAFSLRDLTMTLHPLVTH